MRKTTFFDSSSIKTFAFLTIIALASPWGTLKAQSITEITTSLANNSGKMQFVDVNNDNKLDVFFTGYDLNGDNLTSLYIGNGTNGSFTTLTAPFFQVSPSIFAFGDLDRDGFQDLFLTGIDANGDKKSGIFKNTNGVFTLIDTTIVAGQAGEAEWGDFDNDGDLDLLISGAIWNPGLMQFAPKTFIYENNAMVFTQVAGTLPNLSSSQVKWVDYDQNGNLDAFVTGDSSNQRKSPILLKNTNGVFASDLSFAPTAVLAPKVSWGDYNSDGAPDFAISGIEANLPFSKLSVYKNLGGIFSAVADSFAPLIRGELVWGDLGNDGYLELSACGNLAIGVDSALLYSFNNTLQSFAELPFPPSFTNQVRSLALGDFNNNGSLDVLAGLTSDTKLFTVTPLLTNTPPAAPTGVSYTINADSSITFQWQAPTGDQTPSAGLSYSVMIGTTPNGTEISSPPADPTTGFRRVVEYGQVVTTTWTLKNVSCDNDYYFRVQAVDGGYMGSPFSASVQVVLKPTASISSFNGETLTAGTTGIVQDSLNWTNATGNPIPGATSNTFTITATRTIGLIVYAGQCSDTLAPAQFIWVANENPRAVSNVKIWPNPSSTVLHVRVDNPGATESIAIYDMQGRLMRSVTTGIATETTLPVEDLVSGLYIVKLSLTNGRGLSTATFRKD